MKTKIAVQFNNTTVDAVDFPVTSDDLKLMAHGYYMERLAYEYECWAEGADFAPNTQEWFGYHFAGERLTAIEAIIGDHQAKHMKKMAESTWLYNNKIDNDLWIEFLKVGTQWK